MTGEGKGRGRKGIPIRLSTSRAGCGAPSHDPEILPQRIRDLLFTPTYFHILYRGLSSGYITKYRGLWGLNNSHEFSHSSVGWNCETGRPGASGSGEGPPPACRCSLTESSLGEEDSACCSYKGTSRTFDLLSVNITTCQPRLQTTSLWGLGLQYLNLGGYNSVHSSH